jgi:hypothetical protein
MDVVYVNRDGDNPELRYSLRTLANVEHDRVWIFGGAPTWINFTTVTHQKRMQAGTPYSSTRGHIQAACNTAEVSDPFLLWNDDFYAMHPVGEVPIYHRGPLDPLLEKCATMKTPWWKGLRETAALMEKRGLLAGALSYDTHLPLVVYKTEMREALRLAKNVRADAVHLRTLYGAVTDFEGVEHHDPKLMRRSDPFPRGAWLSSSDDTFRSTVEPVLRYLFPDKSHYERGQHG